MVDLASSANNLNSQQMFRISKHQRRNALPLSMFHFVLQRWPLNRFVLVRCRWQSICQLLNRLLMNLANHERVFPANLKIVIMITNPKKWKIERTAFGETLTGSLIRLVDPVVNRRFIRSLADSLSVIHR